MIFAFTRSEARAFSGCCVLAYLLLGLTSNQTASASTLNGWNVSGGGVWGSTLNWNTGHIPTSQEDATVGSIATSLTSPVTVTLDANRTAYGLTLDPGAGKAIHIDSGGQSTISLALASTDTSPDGVAKFFTLNVPSGTGNQINAPIQLGDGTLSSFPAMINSFDPNFAIRGGIKEASDRPRGVRIVGISQGIVSLAQTSSTYSGDTTIGAGGILRIDVSNALPSGAGKGNVVLEGNGQLHVLNATSLAINGLSSNSSTAVVTNDPGNNATTLTMGNNNATAAYAGSITNANAGLFNLVKTGTGTETLSGTNSYRGTTTISNGTLLINGTHTSAGSYAVNVSTATLGGNGTINLADAKSSVSVTAGKLAAGSGGPGILNINGALTLSGIGTLAVELGGNTPGVGAGFYDQVNMTSPTGTINTSFAHLGVTLLNGFVPQPTDVFYILTRADSGIFPVIQPFDAISEGTFITLGAGRIGQITYKANWTGNQATSTLTGGNDMAIFNVVPEPTSGVLLMFGVMIALLMDRRSTPNVAFD